MIRLPPRATLTDNTLSLHDALPICVDEEADVPVGRAGCLGLLQGGILAAAESHEDIGEIDAAEQQADRWHQNVGDEGAADLAEGGTDDNADSHVEDAAPPGELLEFFQHGEFPSSACATTLGPAAALPTSSEQARVGRG